jgi:predicted metalloprotease with PDZ domain
MRCLPSLTLVGLLLSGISCHKAPAQPQNKAPATKANGALLTKTVVAKNETPSMEGQVIRYRVSFAGAAHHDLKVEGIIPTQGRGELTVMMPTWTPGSYKIRDYAKHLESFHATTMQGVPLKVEKTHKNRWHIWTRLADEIKVSYIVHCRKMSVRGNWLDSEMAILNGAPTFLNVAGASKASFSIEMVLPAHWQQVVTGLTSKRHQPNPTFHADSYDQLVDSPWLLGNPKLSAFSINGILHRMAYIGDTDWWDLKNITQDVKTVTQTIADFWGTLPYERYTYLNVIAQGRGGLEHLNSTLMLSDRWASKDRKSYLDWLGLVSHEFFHTWNGKRLRPHNLGPFDYENETYTKSLWVVEGLTSYYDDLLLHRSGLTTRKEYLSHLSKSIKQLQATPGRLKHALDMTSFDAWTKYYQQDKNFINTSVSYYTKGAVVGFLLDALLREHSHHRTTLDEVMVEAYQQFGAKKGYRVEDFKRVAEKMAGVSLDAFYQHAISGRGELDYSQALAFYGLRFTEDTLADESNHAQTLSLYLGWKLDLRGGKVWVKEILDNTPAYHAGVQVDDEVLALNGYRVLSTDLSAQLEHYSTGQLVEIAVSRMGKLKNLQGVLSQKPRTTWNLSPVEKPSPKQLQNLQRWLTLPSGAKASSSPLQK